MTEKNEKKSQNKHGAGKFFLGAALGAAAGALASKFIKIDFTSDDETAEKSKTKSCECGDDCKCDKDTKCDCDKKKVTEKKPTSEKK